jgi:hypothetical protein
MVGLSLMNMLGLSSNVRIAHIACYWKCFLLHYTQVLCQYRLYTTDHAYLTCLMLQRQLCHLTTAKFKPLIFSMSGFTLTYTTNMFILMVLYDFCLWSAQFCYIISWRLKAVCKSRTGVYLGNFPMVRRTLFCTRCNFKSRCLLLIPRRDKRKSLLIWSVPYGGFD